MMEKLGRRGGEGDDRNTVAYEEEGLIAVVVCNQGCVHFARLLSLEDASGVCYFFPWLPVYIHR